MFHNLLLILIAVILLGQLFAYPLKWLRQPLVIGEIFAGILLGPSLLGYISPDAYLFLVPDSADSDRRVLPLLNAVALLGVTLYVFLVGLDLDLSKIASKSRTAYWITAIGILLPMIFGMFLGVSLYPAYTGSDISSFYFALFIGVAVSITAFPILARILMDRGLEHTKLGILALSCAAADDVLSWCLLAIVISAVKTDPKQALLAVFGTLSLAALLFFIVKPVAARWIARQDATPDAPFRLGPAIIIGVLICAYITDEIGIHPVFGGFLFGLVMPKNSPSLKAFATRLKEPVLIFLVPAFFAATGLRTQFSLLESASDWLLCGLIILVSTVGKFGGISLVACWQGVGLRQSLAVGILMNTRALMEIIILTIGLDLGIINDKLFAMMIIMALFTTVMTSPILALIIPPARQAELVPD